ncbi:MAG TPA: hypothetical protein QF753_08820 [Victivallales bacterium]|nr:hypothetical protein [Victivallales bacterium]
MKKNITYEFHHLGLPTSDIRPNEIYSPVMKMYTSDNPGKFKIQWHRFKNDTPLDSLITTLPHIAFKVNDLDSAIEGEKILLGPYEPIDGFKVAIINDNGVPVELTETKLTDKELWNRAKNGEGSLYRE